MPKEVKIKYTVDTSGLDEAKRKLLELASIQSQAGGGPRGEYRTGAPQAPWNQIPVAGQQQSMGGGSFGGRPVGGGQPAGGPGMGGFFGGAMAGRGGGFLGGLASFHGVQSIMSGLNQTAQQYDPNYMNGSATVQRFGYNTANNLTFGLSGQAWSIGDRMGMGSNIQNRMEALQRSQGISASSHEMRMGMQGIQNQQTSALYGLRQEQNDARAGAQASGAFANRLQNTPGLLDSFNTMIPKIGQENEQTGAARLAAERGQVGLNESRAAVASQQKLVQEAEARAKAASANTETARGRLAEATSKASALEGTEGTGTAKAGALAEARQAQKNANDTFSGSLADETEKKKQAQEAINDLREKEKQLAAQQLQADQALLGVKKNQLDVLKEEVAMGRAGAKQIGMSTVGEKDFLMRSAKKFKESGFDSLNPMEKQALSGNAITSREVGREAEKSGEATAKALGDLGFSAGDVEGNKAKAGDKLKEVTIDEAKIEAAFKKQLSDIAETTGTKLADAVKDTFRTMLQAFVAEMAGKEMAKQVSNSVGQSK